MLLTKQLIIIIIIIGTISSFNSTIKAKYNPTKYDLKNQNLKSSKTI